MTEPLPPPGRGTTVSFRVGTAAVVLCALAIAPARAQLVDDAPLKRFDESEPADPFVDALLLRRAWEVVAASSMHREVARASRDRRVAALGDAPDALPSLDEGPTDVDGLAALLADGGDPFVRSTRALRLLRGVRLRAGERPADLEATIAPLDSRAPGHPWLAALRARWAFLAVLDRRFELAGLPDPRTARRVHVRTGDLARDLDGDEVEPPALAVTRGWLASDDGRRFTVVLDSFRTTTFPRGARSAHFCRARGDPGPLPRFDDADALAEARAWLARPPTDREWEDLDGSLELRGAALQRAWWALRRGEPWLAFDLVGEALDWTSFELLDVVLSDQLAARAWHDAIQALGAGRPRVEAIAHVRRALALGQEAPRLDRPESEELDDLLRRSESLLAGLEAQLADPPPPVPAWADWQRLAPDQRLGHLLRALGDQDGRQIMQPGACDLSLGQQRVPADAPEVPGPSGGFGRGSGRTAADGLLELGDLAVEPLLALLGSPAPTRAVEYFRDFALGSHEVLTQGEVARRTLGWLRGERVQDAAEARTWWAEWRAEGGLLAWRLSRLSTAPEQDARARHGRWLALRGGAAARPALHARLREAGRGEVATRFGAGRDLLEALAERPEPVDAPLFLAAVWGPSEEEAALGARGLAALGDARGVEALRRRARHLIDAGAWQAGVALEALVELGDAEGTTLALERTASVVEEGRYDPFWLLRPLLARAPAPPAAVELLLRVVERLPGLDVSSADGLAAVASQDRTAAILGLARIATRPRGPAATPHDLELLNPDESDWDAVDDRDRGLRPLGRLLGGLDEASLVDPAARDAAIARLVPDALAALGPLPDARRRHAEATLLALGLEAIGAFEARGGAPVRPGLLARLRAGERALIDETAIHGAPAIAWLEAGADAQDDALRAAFARARARARLVVRDVVCADGGLRFVACGGRGRPWSPEHLAHLLSIWQGQAPVDGWLELVTEPRAEGVALVVRRDGASATREGEAAWTLVVSARDAAGDVRERASPGGPPSEQLVALLAAAGAEELLAGPRGESAPVVWIKARRTR